MYCSYCGKPVGDDDQFCSQCGRSIRGRRTIQSTVGAPESSSTAEQVLYSFGPFGMVVQNGRPSAWKWYRRNSVIVELTDRRICALPNRKYGLMTVPAVKWTPIKLPFEIPYDSIVSVDIYPHPVGLGLMEVLDIKYREGNVLSEKSISSYKNNIERARQVIESCWHGSIGDQGRSALETLTSR